MKNQKQGFTLVEVIIAIAITVTALISAIVLIAFSSSSIKINKSKIIAVGLAQEGLEVVKNIRDNNWLHNCPVCDRRTAANWRIGLGEGDWRVQYNLETLLSFEADPLKIDGNGLYQYINGPETFFYRRVNIQYLTDDQIKVISQITWNEKGKDQTISAEAVYYNWLKEE